MFGSLRPPPIAQGVESVESWASGLNLRVAVAIGSASEAQAHRLRAIATVLRELGRMKDKARRHEKALRLRRLRLAASDAIVLADPPFEDGAAQIPWAYAALAQEAFEASTDPKWNQRTRMRRVRVLAQQGFLPCNHELRSISDAVDALGG